jgi:4-hydroxy-3-polyprenylbenzoate decarboxylase
LQLLKDMVEVETHLILTSSAHRTIEHETEYKPDEVRALADHLYSPRDIGAAIASGSFVTAGMLVAPCSVKTLSGIAHSYDENPGCPGRRCVSEGTPPGGVDAARDAVACRAHRADGSGHPQRCDHHAACAGVLRPADDARRCGDQTVGRALELLDVSTPGLKRWGGAEAAPDSNGRVARIDSAAE